MFEKPTFGKRNLIETKTEEKSDFEKDRPMYERLRDHNPQIDELLTEYDGLIAFQKAGHGVQEDEKEKKRIQEALKKAFRETN